MSVDWSKLGHTLGECYHDSEKSCTYVNIPKNASSFIKGCLLGTGKFEYSNTMISAETYLVALRDPVERWCSGMSQFIKNNNDMSILDAVEKITWDDHTEQQIYFIKNIDHDKTVFFLVDSNFSKNLQSWLDQQDYRANCNDNTYSNSSDQQGTTELKKRLILDVDSNESIKLKLLNHYKQDIDLINRVKFYGI